MGQPLCIASCSPVQDLLGGALTYLNHCQTGGHGINKFSSLGMVYQYLIYMLYGFIALYLI